MTGASTLPSGEVVLILNPIDLIDRAFSPAVSTQALAVIGEAA
jgi:hypothetical protein